ncbi:MAG: acyltransferase [Bacteroidales bacterium]|nr:acyltransferase [Bacteroidales bacterium]
MTPDLPDSIFAIKGEPGFLRTALEVFRYQSENNTLYKNYIAFLGKRVEDITMLSDIPFMPVEFFRSQTVIIDNKTAEKVFESSRTSFNIPGRHYVHDLKLYERSYLEGFRLFYGDPSDYVVTALLPSYAERGNSSLVYMVNGLISKSVDRASGFYTNNRSELTRNLRESVSRGRKSILIGVSFALLDLADEEEPDLSGTIVMETGGMKGRRKEITRAELHEILKEKFNLKVIHSEYGMTELLSQAYSHEEGIFYTPPWMKVFLRDPYDPLCILTEPGKTGGINIIDLANYHSCSFIATGDLGRLHAGGGFEVLGRFDNSDIRGCNLLID